ncbi:asparagine synthase (glutamine-hydrolyzing) [Methyloversatilis discipulorum]|uniref:asparagine synthase (glutamine-hydrolyzing) n=1 Tax=Methyloversatilis discipulorum TaxID=1119528 RepID=UPI0031383FB4
MCAIAGIWSTSGDPLHPMLRSMAATMVHRGPDDEGVWVDAGRGLGLCHRRLSIVDLSPAGHQPMHSVCGRWVIAFNGEIYNHAELRAELEAEDGAGTLWRGHSDTETLLAAFARWGFEQTLRRCVGMFAIALWDRRERVLRLARDRLGEKPLYFGRHAGGVVFASELKAFAALPDWQPEIDRQAVALFMRYAYVPAPWSIYRDIRKLEPGTTVTFDAADAAPRLDCYWEPMQAFCAAREHPFIGSLGDAADALEGLLDRSVRMQSVADVPLGAFLSGGIDSSTVVALMQKHAAEPVRTFSIGFDEKGFDEAHHAAAVARHLGTLHTEHYVSADEALAVVPLLPSLYDEPFGDPSQIPTYLVSKLARSQVTVSLSGDGGDELFGGYSRYFIANALWRRLERLPRPLRTGAAMMIRSLKPATLSRLIRPLAPLLPSAHRYANPGDKLHKLAEVLALTEPRAVYDRLMRFWEWDVCPGVAPPAALAADSGWARFGMMDAMMYADTVAYLPDDILVKVDRASMAVGLESRVPLLDHRVVEFAWSLPDSARTGDGLGKRVLREVLSRHVPTALTDRPKMGFGIPLAEWLRGPLRNWADDLLDPSRLHADGFLDPDLVLGRWREHLAGTRDWQYSIWNALMFQAWRDRWHG